MRKSVLLRVVYEQIDPARSQIQTSSGLFSNADVKEIPNAIALMSADS
jgi:hypothetical protein